MHTTELLLLLSTQRRRHQIWPNKIVAEPMHFIVVILLPEMMWIERSGACDTGFVCDEKILKKNFIFLFLPQVPTWKLFTREVDGRVQILHFSEDGKDVENMPHVDLVLYF